MLAALQLLRKRLRLGKQVFGTGIGLDGVDHDADTFHQLFEERLVRVAEAFKRGKFDDPFDLAFKNDRQYQDVAWHAAAQAR